MFSLKYCYILIFIALLKCSVVKTNDLNLSKEVCQCSAKKDLPIFDERFDKMPSECYFPVISHDCASATNCTKRSGIYKIQLSQVSNQPIYVVCDDEIVDGDWLIIQRRQDGSQDFYRNWTEYENGFGDINGEFFIGLKNLYHLTNFNGLQELLVWLEDDNNTKVYAKYESFAIGDESESYKLTSLGKYSGTAGDSLTYHIGMKFTTKDRDNDLVSEYNCAERLTGAWWYRSCHRSNLNGKYGDNELGKGVNWYLFRGHTFSLPYAKMMIRRSRHV